MVTMMTMIMIMIMIVFVKWSTDESVSKPFIQMGNCGIAISAGSHYRKPPSEFELARSLASDL